MPKVDDYQFLDDPLEREPAWLTSAVDQDIQRVKAALALGKLQLSPNAGVVMLMLGEYKTIGMTEAQFATWNQTCDGCGKIFRNGEGLVFAHVRRDFGRGIEATITFAACLDCMTKP
jgi:hypothetical protein